MNKTLNYIKNNILKVTLIYLVIYILFGLIINLFNYTYLVYFSWLSLIAIILGIIIGTIQSINRDEDSKLSKFFLITLCVSIEVFFACIVLLTKVAFTNIEILTIVNGRIMLENKHSFLLSNWIDYYDYVNPIIRSKQPRIHKAYDDSLSEENYLYTVYYDQNGNVIKKINE